ncbi:MAG: hypothetical protein LBC85_06915 [Fibromonadaceae bacterium]|jgi:phosphoribosylaminoimidazole-succinocarboxamide synthase|nr:hypothetical protein [Fibromonadaceae bacterium]
MTEQEKMLQEYMLEQEAVSKKMFEERGAELLGIGKTKAIGKTKDGNVLMRFLDSYTGTAGVKDGGGNEVAGYSTGLGHMNMMTSWTIFKMISDECGIPTQNISVDPENNILTAKLVTLLGKGMPFQYNGKEWISKGVEVIARNNAVGSYLKRHPNVEKGTSLLNEKGLPLIECSVKEDEAGDPIFDKNVFVGSGYVSEQDYDKVSLWTQQATKFLTDFFKKKGLELQDTKMEYGYTQEGILVLADEISTGTSRVWHADGTSAKDKEIFEATC